MPTDVTLISARRSYEFKFDDLRLTALSVAANQEGLRELLHFSSVEVRAPDVTFDAVVPMFPPGLVFVLGEWRDAEGQVYPIRFLNVEPTRIVIDVAGPSRAISGIFATIRTWADTLTLPDGARAISEPNTTRDLTEITSTIDFDLKSLLQPWAAELFSDQARSAEETVSAEMAPTIMIRSVPANGVFGPGPPLIILEYRSATNLAEHRLWSSARVDTAKHLELLEQLEAKGGRSE